ncbi:GNAT family N-acetyltransferase [Rubrobacter tropicus]|uniref:GNAT family N-acetyltransferase n=2 Tax=Rubrobacter tropicus TaxID=2653851 RepID=A0A6G8QBK8_9ACTN|nr:GNAT family N-acetyltransferase [Rubrobacter tropicus]
MPAAAAFDRSGERQFPAGLRGVSNRPHDEVGRRMGAGYELREATEEDAAEIHALARELAGAVGDAIPDESAVRTRLGELIEEPRARVFVAEAEDEVAGVVSLWIKPDLAHGDAVVEVPMLVVSEGHRRNGVGKLLMARTQEVAAENDASIIELVATNANVAARDFYKSLGFVEADVVALEFVGDAENPPET